MYPPGLRLRQARESLGLTYRDVEQASYEIAARRGRPEFILHISRPADIENRKVVSSLHKLYSLATIYHLSPLKISGWYEAPFLQTFDDGAAFPAPLTHLCEPSTAPKATGSEGIRLYGLMERAAEYRSDLSRHETELHPALPLWFIGLSDRRMAPILRPGSIVLVDMALRRIEDEDWLSECDRPLYFVETRTGYRCGWFQKLKSRLIMQPHTLSRCTPEAWRTPEEAEVVGKVVGVLTYLNDPWASARGATRTAPPNWIEKAV